MNHTRTALSVDAHAAENATVRPGVPYILGETNSLYNQGRPGLSNAFGAALWGIDFAVYSASVGIGRVHFHMGTDYRWESFVISLPLFAELISSYLLLLFFL